jgi:hypothetical protein
VGARDLEQRWLLRGAALVGFPAPGAEAAARWRAGRAGQLTVQQDPVARGLPQRIWHGDGRQQGGGVGMRRILADRLGRALFHDDPQVHDRDLVRHLPDHRQVMGDEQVGHIPFALQVAQQIEDAGLDAHVQCGNRLVEDQDLRLERQGPGDADALPLSAGELGREPDGGVRVEAHGRQQLTDPARPSRDLVHGQRLTDDLPDRQPRIERGVRILEDHLQVTPERPERAIVQAGQFGAVQLDAARGGLFQPHEQPGDRGLAAA